MIVRGIFDVDYIIRNHLRRHADRHEQVAAYIVPGAQIYVRETRIQVPTFE